MLVKAVTEAKILGDSAQHIIAMRKVSFGHVALAIMAHGAAIEPLLHNVGSARQGKLLAISGVDSKALKLAPAAF